MWLFDDLINKASAPQDGGVSATSGSSQSSGWTGNPQSGWSQGWSTGQGSDPLAIVTPPIIETVNEWSIMTEAPVIPQPVLPDTPAVTTNTAQDGDELLIVSESAPTKEATVAEDADAPLVPITETSVVTPEPILEPSTQLVTENAVFSSLIWWDAHQE